MPLMKAELTAPPAAPIWWRVLWYRAPGGEAVCPPGVLRVRDRTWFGARAQALKELATENAEYVEIMSEGEP